MSRVIEGPRSPSECETRPDAMLNGVVAASIYQGDHVDLYIDVPQAASGRIHMRLSARDATGISGNGSKIAINIGSEDLVAFPQAGNEV